LILLLDNYDSFTYNLYQYLSELGQTVKVIRNDRIDIQQISELDPERIIISPGPCGPSQAGISVDVVKAFSPIKPLLGVCLGHQCVGTAFGGVVKEAGEIMHGKMSDIFHDGKGVFKNIPNPFKGIRYHSLSVVPNTIPEELEISATTNNGIIMGIRHKEYLTEGIQFHPESIMTTHGKQILSNFLELG